MRIYVLMMSVVSALMLSSCDNSSNSDFEKTAAPPTSNNQQQEAPPPPPPPPVEPAPPVVKPLPVVSFGYETYVYDGEHEIHLELLLNEASDTPVVVDVELVDGTAILHRDYAGFMEGGDVERRTFVFEPQQVRIDLPHIYIMDEAECDAEFTAQFVKGSVQNADVKNESTRIVLKCDEP